MTAEEILAELRTIRTLLALDKEEELDEIMNNLDEVEQAIIKKLDNAWGSLPTSEIAEECNVANRTVQRRIKRLEKSHLIEKQGNVGGREYRETGLLRAAELVCSD